MLRSNTSCITSRFRPRMVPRRSESAIKHFQPSPTQRILRSIITEPPGRAVFLTASRPQNRKTVKFHIANRLFPFPVTRILVGPELVPEVSSLKSRSLLSLPIFPRKGWELGRRIPEVGKPSAGHGRAGVAGVGATDSTVGDAKLRGARLPLKNQLNSSQLAQVRDWLEDSVRITEMTQ